MASRSLLVLALLAAAMLAAATVAREVPSSVRVRDWPGVLAAAPASGPEVVESIVTLTAAVTVASLVVWYAVSFGAACACVVAAATGRRWRAGERALRRWGAPVLRGTAISILGAIAGTALGASVAAAQAPGLPDDLGWQISSPIGPPAVDHRYHERTSGDDTLTTDAPSAPDAASTPAPGDAPATDASTPDARPTNASTPAGASARGEAAAARAGDVSTPGEAAGTDAGPPATSTPQVHVVRAGDCLWTVASQHLKVRGARATDAAVAAEWPRWYRANAEVIGADPDLIHPGQTLVAPTADGDDR